MGENGTKTRSRKEGIEAFLSESEREMGRKTCSHTRSLGYLHRMSKRNTHRWIETGMNDVKLATTA